MTVEEIREPEHILKVVEELSARWARARRAELGKTDPHFNQGRAEGYVQAVQLLLGVDRPHALDVIRESSRRANGRSPSAS